MGRLIGLDGEPLYSREEAAGLQEQLSELMSDPVVVALAATILEDHRFVRATGDHDADVRNALRMSAEYTLGCLQLAKRYADVVMAAGR